MQYYHRFWDTPFQCDFENAATTTAIPPIGVTPVMAIIISICDSYQDS